MDIGFSELMAMMQQAGMPGEHKEMKMAYKDDDGMGRYEMAKDLMAKGQEMVEMAKAMMAERGMKRDADGDDNSSDMKRFCSDGSKVKGIIAVLKRKKQDGGDGPDHMLG